ncbi:MAG: hypothetical protein MJE77_40295 [Proteobacteria bacterium]|nr:hypothetical protein [Pseudomonadota bacterium]
MLEWIGSLRLREHSSMRVVLSLSRSTRIAGLVLLVGGGYLALVMWAISPLWALLPGMLVMLGAVLTSMRRDFIFDREDGVLRMERRALGIGTRSVVPLFHLRAVVIVARSVDGKSIPFSPVTPARYIAFIDRRVGNAIYLDEARRCATLLTMAEAIAELTELRLEYDATFCASE